MNLFEIIFQYNNQIGYYSDLLHQINKTLLMTKLTYIVIPAGELLVVGRGCAKGRHCQLVDFRACL